MYLVILLMLVSLAAANNLFSVRTNTITKDSFHYSPSNPASQVNNTVIFDLPTPYNSSYNRYLVLGGYHIRQQQSIEFLIEFIANYVSSTQVRMQSYNGTELVRVNLYVLFVLDGNQFIVMSSATHVMADINTGSGGGSQVFNVAIPTGSGGVSWQTATTEIVVYLTYFKSSGFTQETVIRVTIGSWINSNTLSITVNRANTIQQIYQVGVVVSIMNITYQAQNNIYKWRYIHTFTTDRLTAAIIATIPAPFYYSYGGYQKHCIFGFSRLQIGGANNLLVLQTYFFDSTNPPNQLSHNVENTANYTMQVQWNCYYKCSAGLYIGTSNCVPCLSNCSYCLNGVTCLICLVNLGLNIDSTACLPCPDITQGCQTCANSSFCYSCINDSFTINTNNLCSPCSDFILNCITCINSSECLQCNETYYFNSQFQICLPCESISTNCFLCNNIQNCLNCTQGYLLSLNGTCNPCLDTYPYCLTCDVVNCLSCFTTAYFDINSDCITCSDRFQNCLECNNDTICTLCITGFGYNIISQQCLPCSQAFPSCIQCNSSICLTCPSLMILYSNNRECVCFLGWQAGTTCTTIVGCVQAFTNPDGIVECVACDTSTFHREPVNGLCSCLEGKLLQSVCNVVTGCLVADSPNTCIFCDSSTDFQISPNALSLCDCRLLFNLVDVNCVDLCGDGVMAKKTFTNCDDGNFADGDGCSSSCLVENYYKCQNGSITTPSICIYEGIPITLTQGSVLRTEGLNQGTFEFSITPPLVIISHMDLLKYTDFTCDAQHTVVSVSYFSGVLRIVSDYTTNMEGKLCNITMSFDPTIINSVSANLTFTVASSNGPLTISSSIEAYSTFGNLFTILSYIVLAIFFLSLGHKMVGAELLVNCQIVYFSSGFYNQLPFLTTSVTTFNRVTGIWFFNSQSYKDLFLPFSAEVQMSPYFTQNTVLIVSTLLLFSMLLLFLRLYSLIVADEQGQGSAKTEKLQKFIYVTFIFPVAVGFFCIIVISVFLNNLRIQISTQSAFSPTINSLFLVFAWTVVGVVLGIEVLTSFQKGKKNGSEIGGLKGAKNWYITFYLTKYLLFCMAVQIYLISPSKQLVCSISLLFIIFFVLTIFNRPYYKAFDNIGLLLCEFVGLLAIILSSLSYFITLQEQIWVFILFILQGLIMIAALCSLIRIAIIYKTWYFDKAFQQEVKKPTGKANKVSKHQINDEFKALDFNPYSLQQGNQQQRKSKRKKGKTNHVGPQVDQQNIISKKQKVSVQDELFLMAKKRLREDFLQHKKKRRMMENSSN